MQTQGDAQVTGRAINAYSIDSDVTTLRKQSIEMNGHTRNNSLEMDNS